MASLRTKLASVLVTLCAATALAACGDESGGDEPSATDPTSQESPSPDGETPTESGGLPECTDVWIDGQDLPKDYTACSTDGETVKPVKRTCGYGAKFLEQDGRFYAMAGKQITDAGDLATSEQYQQLLATCQA